MSKLLKILALVVAVAGCGQDATDKEPLPVLTATQYPSVGFVEAGDSDCSGALISSRTVLTAAHCVFDRKVSELSFTLDATPGKQSIFARAEGIRIHPEYTDKDDVLGVDVAIIVLASTDYGMPVPAVMPFADDKTLQGKDTLFNVGYGENKNGTSGLKRRKDLRFSELTDLPLLNGVVLDGNVRVVRGANGEIGCAGDSGSPLVLERQGRVTIAGVYSTSESDARRGVPEKKLCREGITHGNYIGPSAFLGWLRAQATP